MLLIVKADCRSTTGNNLRRLMLQVNKTNLDVVTKKDLDTQVYDNAPDCDKWKVELAKEILQVKNKQLELHSLTYKEMDDILESITT